MPQDGGGGTEVGGGLAEGGEEAVEEEFLAAEDFFVGDGDGEPGAAVGFGDLHLAAGARRPLDKAGIGDQGRGVEVALDSPGGDVFTGGLADEAEGDEVTVNGRAGFFLELAARGFEGFLAVLVLTFGDGPGIFFCPEGTAGVDEEDFDAVFGAAEEEDSGGGSRHGFSSLSSVGQWKREAARVAEAKSRDSGRWYTRGKTEGRVWDLKNVTRKGAVVILLALVAGVPGFARDKTESQAPVAWGMQSGNDGCVIFRESETTMTDNEGGSYKSYTVKQLEVVEAIKASLPKKKYSETKEDLDALQELSMQDHLKFVKIPKKYTPEQMEKAKALCGVQ